MPKKVLPTLGDIETISQELTVRGFFPVQGLERFRRTTKDERAIPPPHREGGELGFAFQKDDLTVTAWTTWLLAEGKARESDCGWIVIEQAGTGIYFVPVHRTKNFADRLLMEAKIARCRVRNRPTCPKCGKQMRIVSGDGLGSRYWHCDRDNKNMPWDTVPFLTNLPVEAQRHLTRRRKNRRQWYTKCRKNGTPIRQAMLKRRPWRKVKLTASGF